MQIETEIEITRAGQAEINRIIGIAADTQGQLSGMTYEEGVRAALDWIMGNQSETPFE